MGEETIKIKGYTIEDKSKWVRAIEGTVGKSGALFGGVSEDASDEIKLAAYDRLGGLIKYKGEKVKMGSFCNFKESKKFNKVVPIEEPEPLLEFRVNKEVVYVPIDKPKPMKVKVAEMAEEQAKAKK